MCHLNSDSLNEACYATEVTVTFSWKVRDAVNAMSNKEGLQTSQEAKEKERLCGAPDGSAGFDLAGCGPNAAHWESEGG